MLCPSCSPWPSCVRPVFIVTFFLGQTYAYWRTSFSLGRSIQGRLHDMNMMLAAHARRDKRGAFTPESRDLLESTQRNLRLLHAFFWMSNDDSLRILHDPSALPRLVTKGLLTEDELLAVEAHKKLSERDFLERSMAYKQKRDEKLQ